MIRKSEVNFDSEGLRNMPRLHLDLPEETSLLNRLLNSLESSLPLFTPTDSDEHSEANIEIHKDCNTPIALARVFTAKQISTLGMYHPCTAASISVLGLLYHDAHDYLNSLRVYKELLMIEPYIYGKDSSEVANTMHSIGLIIQKIGGHDEKALCYFHSSLYLHLKAFESRHLEISNCLFNIGYIHMANGNEDNQALRFLKQSIYMRRIQSNPNNDCHIITTLLYIGNIHQRNGDLLNASECLREAVEMTRSSPQVLDSMFIARTLNQIGNLHLQLGDTGRMMSAFGEAVRVLQQVDGNDATIEISGQDLHSISKLHPECAAVA
jgi:tetratricopeptide (TPR) repeat protein